MGTYSVVAGRIGTIIDKVYRLMNDTKGGTDTTARFLQPSDMYLFMDTAMSEIATEGYWQDSITLTYPANATSYYLAPQIPHLQRVMAVDLAARYFSVEFVSDASYWQQITKGSLLFPWARGYPLFLRRIYGYLAGDNLSLWPIPLTNTDILVRYSWLPGPIGEIAIAGAVVNKGDGTVGIPAVLNGRIAGDEIDIVGSTNYSGNHFLVSATTNEMVITHAYSAETLPTAAKCYGQPRFPATHDDLLVYFCMKEHSSLDSGRRASNYANWERRYLNELSELTRSRELRIWASR